MVFVAPARPSNAPTTRPNQGGGGKLPPEAADAAVSVEDGLDALGIGADGATVDQPDGDGDGGDGADDVQPGDDAQGGTDNDDGADDFVDGDVDGGDDTDVVAEAPKPKTPDPRSTAARMQRKLAAKDGEIQQLRERDEKWHLTATMYKTELNLSQDYTKYLEKVLADHAIEVSPEQKQIRELTAEQKRQQARQTLDKTLAKQRQEMQAKAAGEAQTRSLINEAAKVAKKFGVKDNTNLGRKPLLVLLEAWGSDKAESENLSLEEVAKRMTGPAQKRAAGAQRQISTNKGAPPARTNRATRPAGPKTTSNWVDEGVALLNGKG